MQNLSKLLTPTELKYSFRRSLLCDQTSGYGVMQSVLEKACANANQILYGAAIMCLYPNDCFGIRIEEVDGKFRYVSTSELQLCILRGLPEEAKTGAIKAVLGMVVKVKAA